MSREQWIITNISNRSISIGDLVRLPTIDVNLSIDMLNHHSKDEICKSQALSMVFDLGLITITKVIDNESTTAISEEKDYVTSVEKNELNSEVESLNSEIDDLNGEIDDLNNFSIQTITDPTYAATSEDDLLLVDTTLNDVTINLPIAEGNNGLRYYIKKINSGGTLTVNGYLDETIDGEEEILMANQWEAMQIVCDGQNWYII